MDKDYWHKQLPDKALFPDLVWSRPEQKSQAGKLLIVGGNAHGFAVVAEAYTESTKASVGSSRALLPDVLQKTVSHVFSDVIFGSSTPSGSFARQALAELLELSLGSDGVLLAGDLGRNSETAIMLETYVSKYSGQLTITKDALDYFVKLPLKVLDREQTLLVANFSQLQKMATSSKYTSALTFDMDLLRLVDWLHDFTKLHRSAIILKHLDSLCAAYDGQVCTTNLNEDLPIWQVKLAAHASVWWLQNPSKTFEAICSGVAESIKSK